MAGMDLIIASICNATFCNAVYDNPLTDALPSRKELEFTALANEVNGKHLKIATYNNYPLSHVVKDENGTLQGHGIAFTILEMLRQKFNFTFEVVVPEYNFEIGGSKPEDSLLGLVNASKVDMAVAFVPTFLKMHKMVSFSRDLDEGVWMMMLKRPKISAAVTGLSAPFTEFVWYATFASVIAYGPCITLITWIRYMLIRDKEYYLTLSSSFWFVYSAYIKQTTSLSPEAITTRMLFATWWLFILLLSAFYTANLTAFLTLSKFTLDIESPTDLYRKNYQWIAPEGGAVQYSVKNVCLWYEKAMQFSIGRQENSFEFMVRTRVLNADPLLPSDDLYLLNQMVTNGKAVFKPISVDADYLPLVRAGSVLVKEQTAIDHFMYADYMRKASLGVQESDRCTYVVAPNPFMKKQRAFAYPYGSKLKDLFDPVLEQILQSGLINFLKLRDLPTTKICPLDLQSKDRQLSNSDLIMTYYIMIAGIAAAIAVFVGEVLRKRYGNAKVNTEEKSKRKKSRRGGNFATRFYYDSRPPPYESLFSKPKFNNKIEESQTKMINGREYYVIDNNGGGTRLVPVRAPSAVLYR